MLPRRLVLSINGCDRPLERVERLLEWRRSPHAPFGPGFQIHKTRHSCRIARDCAITAGKPSGGAAPARPLRSAARRCRRPAAAPRSLLHTALSVKPYHIGMQITHGNSCWCQHAQCSTAAPQAPWPRRSCRLLAEPRAAQEHRPQSTLEGLRAPPSSGSSHSVCQGATHRWRPSSSASSLACAPAEGRGTQQVLIGCCCQFSRRPTAGTVQCPRAALPADAGSRAAAGPQQAPGNAPVPPHLLVPGQAPCEEALGVFAHVRLRASLGDDRHTALHIPLEQHLPSGGGWSGEHRD